MELPPNARSRAQKAAEARRAARHGMTPGSPSPARSTPPAHDGLPTLTLAEAAARQVELPALPGRPDQTLRHGGALLFRGVANLPYLSISVCKIFIPVCSFLCIFIYIYMCRYI